MSEPASSPPPKDAHRPQKNAITVVKWLVAIVVVVGLGFAARSGIAQWKVEIEKVTLQMDQLDREISQLQDQNRRQELQERRDQLAASAPRLRNLQWNRVFLAGVLYAVGLVPPSFVLRRALVSLGEHPRISTVVSAQLLGHVGKYVPGKAMVIVLRAGVLARDGVRPLTATVSIFLETFLMMAVGAVVAGIIVCWLPVPRWIAITAVIAAVAASLPTLPPILKWVAARVTKVPIKDLDSQIGLRLFAVGWCWSILSWGLIGASFAVLISAIPTAAEMPEPLQLYAVSTAAIALAMVVGFASLLPGGAGIRELVLTTILGASIGAAHGLLAAVAARILFMTVEAALAGLSWCQLRWDSEESGSRHQPEL